jgi:hypothetical protein
VDPAPVMIVVDESKSTFSANVDSDTEFDTIEDQIKNMVKGNQFVTFD